MYFETAAWEMEKPSFKSSPWIPRCAGWRDGALQPHGAHGVPPGPERLQVLGPVRRATKPVRQRPGKRSGKAFRDVEAKPGGRPTLKSGPRLHSVLNQQCLLSEFQQEAGYPHLDRYARERGIWIMRKLQGLVLAFMVLAFMVFAFT